VDIQKMKKKRNEPGGDSYKITSNKITLFELIYSKQNSNRKSSVPQTVRIQYGGTQTESFVFTIYITQEDTDRTKLRKIP
jgi:hypothetical protein